MLILILIFQDESLSSDISRWWLGLSDYDEEVAFCLMSISLYITVTILCHPHVGYFGDFDDLCRL